MKAKKIFLTFYLLSLHFSFYSQSNLVPNPGFETYTVCPTTSDQINRAIGWSSYKESPDYFNNCSTGGLGLPSNVAGYQNANSGVAYAGIVAYSSAGFAREIMGSQLTQTLVVGAKYYVSLNVSLAEFDANTKQFIPCDKIGVKFSKVPFSTVTPTPINNVSHVYTNSIISDTLNWTTIKGVFFADSAYKYIMVGNFFDDANTDTIYRASGVYSYFFVDDICVSTDSMTCYTSTGFNFLEDKKNITVFPNPISSFVSIEWKTDSENILTLYNSIGENILKKSFTNFLEIDVSLFPNGIYFLSIKSKNDTRIKK